jgi:hypothetical protein
MAEHAKRKDRTTFIGKITFGPDSREKFVEMSHHRQMVIGDILFEFPGGCMQIGTSEVTFTLAVPIAPDEHAADENA